MKKVFSCLMAFVLLLSSMAAIAEGSDDPDTIIYGNKVKGDILFNDMAWLTSREDVFNFLKEKFNDVELKETEYVSDYGDVKDIACTYENVNGGTIGVVGEMEISKIKVDYIYQEGKYDGMYAAAYQCEDLQVFDGMAEMLQYKYGDPYSYTDSHNELDSGTGFGFSYTDDVRYKWMNIDETQTLTIQQLDMVTTILGETTSAKWVKISYANAEISTYVEEQEDAYEAAQKEDEMASKDYDGL